jgi:ribonuclease R
MKNTQKPAGRNNPHQKQKSDKAPQTAQGVIKAIRGNTAYFISDTAIKGETPIEISTRFLNTAMANDKVEIKIFTKTRSGKPEGEVIKVISRAKSIFVGTIEVSSKGMLAIPDDRKVRVTVKIPQEKIGSLKDQDKVRVRITKWKSYPEYSEGDVITLLGKKGENSTEMNSIAIDKGFDIDFPETVLAESNIVFKNNQTISEEEYAKRKDLRDTLTFTIDPKSAKDFDDAISFKKLTNGHFEIGVHIADVSHYVTEKSELDKEAYKRGCSVYLPDRTIPMLPFELSDNLCSLNEGEEKLAFSAIFEVDEKAHVHTKWFGKTVIKSDKRFSYESAQEVLNAKSGEHFETLNSLNTIAKLFKKEKFQKGAIDFEREETAFELDEAGRPIRIYKKEILDTHKLVEEYMLLANREVAEFVFKHEKKSGTPFPLPYRIHDLPDKEKINELAIFVKALGYELFIGKNGSVTGRDMQALFAQIEGKAEEALIKTAAIRSMAKAIYSVKNIGHFGLAFEYYAHFTSPIRRYPDLLVHRILYKILSGEKVAEKNYAFYEKACEHSTDQEIKAAEAERDSKKYKQVEYMMDKVGQTFDGSITGVTEWGIYAEDSETKAEGMIKLSSLGDDFYTLDQKTYSIIGEKTKKRYSLGQKIKIKLVSADLDKKMMDFEIVK